MKTVVVNIKPSKYGNYAAMQRKADRELRRLYNFREAESYGRIKETRNLWAYKYKITE